MTTNKLANNTNNKIPAVLSMSYYNVRLGHNDIPLLLGSSRTHCNTLHRVLTMLVIDMPSALTPDHRKDKMVKRWLLSAVPKLPQLPNKWQ